MSSHGSVWTLWLFVFLLVCGVISGKLPSRFGWICRDEKPYQFWFCIFLGSAIIIYLFFTSK